MIDAQQVRRALAAPGALERRKLESVGVEIAVRRMTEPERDRERALAELAAGPFATPAEVDRLYIFRMLAASTFDVDTMHTAHPERFFVGPECVAELSEDACRELLDLVTPLQAPALRFDDEPAGASSLDAAIANLGPLGRIRAEHALELVAFFGVRSALYDLSDEQVLLWFKMRSAPVRKEPEADPTPPPRRRRRSR